MSEGSFRTSSELQTKCYQNLRNAVLVPEAMEFSLPDHGW